MSVFQALVLGTVQGLTEFLPVSSSGHLIFFPVLFGWADQGQAFDVIVHLGTLVAVCVYFREKLFHIAQSFFSRSGSPSDRKLGTLLLLSIIPALVLGFLFEKVWEIEIRSTLVVGIDFIFWGLVLGLADWYGKKNRTKTLESMTPKSAFAIGLAQAIALIPGTSRSGITMTAGLFSGFTKKDAAEFSFLMSVPIIAIAGATKVVGVVGSGEFALGILPIVAGFIASALAGFVAIWGMLRFLQTPNFTPFVVYRIIVGVLILIFLV